MRFNLISDLSSQHQVDLQERGIHYGDGIFETMLLTDGHIKYWQEHYRRLQSSARKLYIGCPSKNWFEINLKPYFDLNRRIVIKIILTRGQGGRGLQLPSDQESNIYLLKYDSPSVSEMPTIKAMFSDITLPQNFNLAGLKHLNRLDYVLATHQLQQHPQYNEALLLNTSGFLVESIINNLFFVKNDIICTPLLDESGVNGVMRQLILKKLKLAGKKVKISTFVKQDLMASDECFLCNSVKGISPITQIESTHFSIGSNTQYLLQEFHGHQGN